MSGRSTEEQTQEGTRQQTEGAKGEVPPNKQEGGGEDWGSLESDNEHEVVLEAGDEKEDVGVLGAEAKRALEVCGEDEGEEALDAGRSGMG